MRESEQRRLLEWFDEYALGSPEQASSSALFREFVRAHADCCERTLGVGHLTGSAWLVDRAGDRVLLTHHRKLGRWLQLGGHADGDPDLARVALREAAEESGLRGLSVGASVFDLDRHWIPARAPDPGHWHYDVRFVVRAGIDDRFVVGDESHALAWRPVVEVAADSATEDSVRRMAQKWLARRR